MDINIDGRNLKHLRFAYYKVFILHSYDKAKHMLTKLAPAKLSS